jgi:hypothetical protein
MEQIKWQEQNGIKSYEKDKISSYELGELLDIQKKKNARKNWQNRVKTLQL